MGKNRKVIKVEGWNIFGCNKLNDYCRECSHSIFKIKLNGYIVVLGRYRVEVYKKNTDKLLPLSKVPRSVHKKIHKFLKEIEQWKFQK